jgi:hypothetical protein
MENEVTKLLAAATTTTTTTTTATATAVDVTSAASVLHYKLILWMSMAVANTI